MLPYLCFGPRHTLTSGSGFSGCPLRMLAPVFPFPAHTLSMRPRSSDHMQYRNFHLLSIGYASRPRLRSRLTQGRSALPWKPWTSGPGGFPPPVSLLIPAFSLPGAPPFLTVRLPCTGDAPLPPILMYGSRASAACFSPGHFRRRTPRPVSCYALFECMAASEPTSWLSSESHILFHLTRTLGP